MSVMIFFCLDVAERVEGFRGFRSPQTSLPPPEQLDVISGYYIGLLAVCDDFAFFFPTHYRKDDPVNIIIYYIIPP